MADVNWNISWNVFNFGALPSCLKVGLLLMWKCDVTIRDVERCLSSTLASTFLKSLLSLWNYLHLFLSIVYTYKKLFVYILLEVYSETTSGCQEFNIWQVIQQRLARFLPQYLEHVPFSDFGPLWLQVIRHQFNQMFEDLIWLWCWIIRENRSYINLYAASPAKVIKSDTCRLSFTS